MGIVGTGLWSFLLCNELIFTAALEGVLVMDHNYRGMRNNIFFLIVFSPGWKEDRHTAPGWKYPQSFSMRCTIHSSRWGASVHNSFLGGLLHTCHFSRCRCTGGNRWSGCWSLRLEFRSCFLSSMWGPLCPIWLSHFMFPFLLFFFFPLFQP